MHTRRHTEPLITFGKSISLFTQGLNTVCGLVTWIRTYRLMEFKVLRAHHWKKVWLGNSEPMVLPNQNQCHQLPSNTQNSPTAPHWALQYDRECRTLTLPHNPAEAVTKRELQWERKQRSVDGSQVHQDSSDSPSLLLFKHLKLLRLHSFFCLLNLTPSIFSAFFPALWFWF